MTDRRTHILLAIRTLQPTNSRRIAEYLGCSTGAINYYIFTYSGLVGLVTNAGNRRANTLRLTQAGEEAVADLFLLRRNGALEVWRLVGEAVTGQVVLGARILETDPK